MNLTYFLFFICIIVCTLIITYWAAKQSKTAGHFYTTAGSLTGIQNGMAIAGDYISAASFLGIVGAIALNWYDGFLYSIGFLVFYLFVMFLIAEPILYLVKYSLGDVSEALFPSTQCCVIMASSTFKISLVCMFTQCVAAGLLSRLMFNSDYSISM